MEGVDYSYDPPNLAELYRLGKRFVVRYVGTPWISKNLSVSEANRLRLVGLDIVAVCQESKSFLLDGLVRGRAAASAANADAMACGMPLGRPIYFALDVDPNTLTATQWGAVEAFLAGASEVLGRERVGVYGGYRAIERLVFSHAAYGWQTYAWSGGQLSSKARLFQYRNDITLAGGRVDLNRSLHADFGQWSLIPELPQEEFEMPYPVIRVAHTDALYAGREKWYALTGHGPVHVPNSESYDVGVKTKQLKPVETVSAREYDVALDLSRRIAAP